MTVAVHVTHEAVHKMGGIGAVLEGLITSPRYQEELSRTILVGPVFEARLSAKDMLGPGGRLIYSSLDKLDEEGRQREFGRVCRRHGGGLIYGTRVLREQWTGRSAEVEVLLVDVVNMSPGPLNEFKWKLHERFDLHSDRHEHIWDFEQYVRLAQPAFDALRCLLANQPHERIVVFGHEFMGVPAALRALMENDERFAAVFHAHEVATSRRIVEDHPAHDTMFYNVIKQANDGGMYMDDVFGSQDGFFKHSLVKASRFCDSVFAVGQFVKEELGFLSKEYAAKDIDVVPNGIPAVNAPEEELRRSRELLRDYGERLLGWRPGFVFSHVARLVNSKAFWRDVNVLEELDRRFVESGETGIFFLLSTEGAVRCTEDVMRMERDYGWPWTHRVGYPDLTGSEICLNRFLQDFNRRSRAIKVVFVNQFGWERERCGARMPEEMKFLDLRKGADVEFGQSIYEPFGISQLEPLTFGATCVPSSVCGCVRFAEEQGSDEAKKSLVVADFVSLNGAGSVDDLVGLSRREFDSVASRTTLEVAERLLERLRRSKENREGGAARAYEFARRMNWDAVAGDFFIPAMRKALKRASQRVKGT